MLHFETVLASTLDLLICFCVTRVDVFRRCGGRPMPEMLEPVTWKGVKGKIESTVRDFVKGL